MKFSIKTAMIGMGLTSVLVAALFSGSPLFMGLLTSAVVLLIPMILVFAICDGRKSRRPFWIGSFIMSLTCVYGGHYWGLFSPLEYEIANLVCTVGSPSLAEYDPTISPQFAVPAFPTSGLQPISPPVSNTFQPVAPVSPTFQPTAVPVGFNNTIYFNSSYDENYQAVVAFVPTFFSILAGVCGGLAALWISKIPPDTEAIQELSLIHI